MLEKLIFPWKISVDHKKFAKFFNAAKQSFPSIEYLIALEISEKQQIRN